MKKYILVGTFIEVKGLYEQLKECDLLLRYALIEDESKENISGLTMIKEHQLNQSEFKDFIFVHCSDDDYHFTKEIHRFLEQYGVKMIWYCEVLKSVIDKIYLGKEDEEIHYNLQEKVYITLQCGFVVGGLETWVTNLYHELIAENIRTKIVNVITPFDGLIYVEPEFYEINENDIIQIQEKRKITIKIGEIIRLLKNSQPKLIIDNGNIETLLALEFLKKKYGLTVSTIHIVHSNHEAFFLRCDIFKDVIGKIYVVSAEIRDNLIKSSTNPSQQIDVEIQYPKIANNEELEKKKLSSNSIVKIAYAARLEVYNKRSNYLIELISELERESISYQLYIAGKGECFDSIKEYIEKYNLCDKVKLLGLIPHSEMNDFWKDKNIFVNFSKTEGMSISFLEAISFGLVPVVTDTSGMKEILGTEKCGIILHRLSQMPMVLKELIGNPQKINQMSGNIVQRFVYLKNSKKGLVKKICQVIER